MRSLSAALPKPPVRVLMLKLPTSINISKSRSNQWKKIFLLFFSPFLVFHQKKETSPELHSTLRKGTERRELGRGQTAHLDAFKSLR